MSKATLSISSKNYSSWSLRGWLLCKFAGLDFTEELLPAHDLSARAELLLLSPSFLVPCLKQGGIKVWDTLAIAEYLSEQHPDAHLWPKEATARAHCRSISGEMHSGFANLRAALPMNIKAKYPGFRIWAGAQADIDRILTVWKEALAASNGPYLFGKTLTVADAMYAPVCSRFTTYDVEMDAECSAYVKRIMALPQMVEWIKGAKAEPAEIEELDVEF